MLTGDPGPEATGLTLTALATVQVEGARAEGDPLSYRIFATREGLVGGTTANGHVITPHDRFVALPVPPGAVAQRQQRLLRAHLRPQRPLRVRAGVGRRPLEHQATTTGTPGREQWRDLPQGTPQAQAAFRNGYNGGKDGFDRKIANPAGIDLADGTFWDDLGLINNATVTVDYLWTGDVRLAKVVDTGPVYAAPARRRRRRGHGRAARRRPGRVRGGRLAADRRRAVRPGGGGAVRRHDRAVRVLGCDLRRSRAGTGPCGSTDPRVSVSPWPRRRSGSRARGRARCRRPCRRSLVGTGAAIGSGTVAPGRALLALVVAVALVIGVNFANDYSDGIRGTDDDRVGPVRLVGSRRSPPRRRSAPRRSSASPSPALAGLTLVSLTRQWWLVAVGARCASRAPGSTPAASAPTATPGSASWPSSCSSGRSRCSARR